MSLASDLTMLPRSSSPVYGETETVKALNFLTFDVEEWYESEFIQETGYKPDNKLSTQLHEQTDIFLRFCNRWGVKATCFVTGEVCRKHPQEVRALYESGHEIASHSNDHTLIYNKSAESFRQDLETSISLINDITGSRVLGFRAPCLSVNKEVSSWFYEILEEEGIIYSSSVYPAKNFLYGYPEANPDIHLVPKRRIVEIPQQLLNLGITKIGFAGGAYLRLLPGWLVNKLISTKNEMGKPVYIYVHPWELVTSYHPVKLSLTKSLIQHWGVKWNARKLEKIVSTRCASFVSMGDYASRILTEFFMESRGV